jgi:hypothetical protein
LLSSDASLSTLVEVARDLARRLDARPGDDVAVRLSRELRLTLAELRSHSPKAESEVDVFLRRISDGGA